MEDFKYRDNSDFNDKDTYEFKTNTGLKKSKANYDKGFWWLNDFYKASSVPTKVIK